MAAIHREAIQKQIQQDWANREYIEVITGSIKKLADFLNSFGNNNDFYYILGYVVLFLTFFIHFLPNNSMI